MSGVKTTETKREPSQQGAALSVISQIGGESAQPALFRLVSRISSARSVTSESADKEFVSTHQSSAPVVHSSARPMIELKGGVTWSHLTALAENGAEFLEITYAPGAVSGTNMSHHEGHEFGLILEGQLVVELGFESYTLNKGDSIIFESTHIA